MVLVVGTVEFTWGFAVLFRFAGCVAAFDIAVMIVAVFVTAEPNAPAMVLFVSSQAPSVTPSPTKESSTGD